MKTKLFVKLRRHYVIYYLNDKDVWMFITKNKWGHNKPSSLSLSGSHDCLLSAVEQVCGLNTTRKLAHKNAIKNGKENILYVSNPKSLLPVDSL
jgi:hypothetical protein